MMNQLNNFDEFDKALWRLLEKNIAPTPYKPEVVFVLANQIKRLFEKADYCRVDSSKLIGKKQNKET